MSGNGAAASYGDLLITSLVVLAAVCVAAFVVVKLVGRFLATGRMRGAHLLDVVARLPLEPRRSLYVVEVAGKTLLVGTSEMGLSVLSELDGAEVKSRAVPTQSFGDLVRSAWTRRRGERGAGRAHVGASVDGDDAGRAHVGASVDGAGGAGRAHVGASVDGADGAGAGRGWVGAAGASGDGAGGAVVATSPVVTAEREDA